jgi:hypothetical protein
MAIIHDIIKLLYYISKIVIALSQSKYKKIKAKNKISDEILKSLSLSLKAVLRIVIRLGLETRKAIEQQI